MQLPDLADTPGPSRGALGSKAANLATAASNGFRVPRGFVIPELAVDELGNELDAAIAAAVARIGDGPFAVRSSGVAEDLPDASYAGLYETFLDVEGADVPDAVRRTFASAHDDRVAAYEHARERPAGETGSARMAVLVQQMVRPRVAGVAFTANPLSGRRNEVVVTAVAGLADSLVSGTDVGEQWIVHGAEAHRERDRGTLDPKDAVAVAALAREVEVLFGVPQDIEWAIDGTGALFLIQARPMTALPEPVSWDPPGPGLWWRNFRLGEWLPEAMTPLFAEWIVPELEEGYLEGMWTTARVRVPFRYAAVNGWYYNTIPIPSPRVLWRILVDSRGRAPWFLYNALARVSHNPAAADRAVLRRLEADWRDRLLPAYRDLVRTADVELASASAPQIGETVDRVCSIAGQYLWLLALVGGSAWKMEGALAAFWSRHLTGPLEGTAIGASGPQVLLRGLGDREAVVPAHAVYSIDWYFATAGERGGAPEAAASDDRASADGLATERRAAESAARDILASRPRLLDRFDRLLAVAQRYAVIREEQARDLTLGWPLLRRCARLLGQRLRTAGTIVDVDDVFFLVRSDVFDTASNHELSARRRRADWESRRRLPAPLTLGTAPRMIGDPVARAVQRARRTESLPEDAILGHPASIGRATGRVRLVAGPEDFPSFRKGEILVAKATAPAWTPLFPLAAAVVTDGGTLAAHASLVAREYGIPAVVGTGDATSRLHTGQLVTVDGGAGAVLPH
ncbi:PEP/pyruvate-binding domain-containing protein [Agromyces sp. Soil535]|uniref:PEP/pyruvate-binding domain-containing protein n=1 Tax=Agromyces sp. Soil535 TaxID=1736390 RepID=UPI001F2C6894|nr:PEP/pyruvate-binding domain-containing protein [Agromyces sp. Soil535]